MRAVDWSTTPLGPVSSWSPSLRNMVGLLLANRFPMLLLWGSQYIQLYNDAYRPILGDKHPASLAQPARECWTEIWHIIGPLFDTPFTGGPATWMDDLFLEIHRKGFFEETHFTIAYSPVPDDTLPSRIGGVIATVHETTRQVIHERRLAALGELSARAAEAKTAEEACVIAAATVARHAKDIPFALIYLLDDEGKTARLAAATGLPADGTDCPAVVELMDTGAGNQPWPLSDAAILESVQVVEDLASRLSGDVPPGPWSDPPRQALVLPIPSNVKHRLAGLLVGGVSARIALDPLYGSFFELVTTQVATAIANARAYDEERRRAEALDELDRAKTAFFSNVSHELRTPLTLMLGPLEEVLDTALAGEQRELLTVVHRNSRRLLKLVNTVLDFSRIEAGRIEAVYEPTDVGALSAELASVFRSAIERAGLRLRVECERLEELVFVDREMWEKIVLNLMSNALKFTLAGEIALVVRQMGAGIELRVRDTGIGITAEELPRVFERFHRVRDARGRTHEGTGIGLALVSELVKLNGGTVGVTSELGGGTTFTVTVPLGSAHLPAERIRAGRTLDSTAVGAAAWVEEALRWLPDDVITEGPLPASTPLASQGVRVLLADDNADMREYLRRLLGSHWSVEAVADGQAALEAARTRRPDLVLADVMMPGLDGFGLLRALRGEAGTSSVPVILLSARAGEESREEGLAAGADDYLIKPFSARELIARVNARLEIARVRQESVERERQARAAAEADSRAKDEFLAMLGHELRNPLGAIASAVGVLNITGSPEESAQRARAVIGRQLQHLSHLVDDLLDVSRLTTGKVRLKRQPLNLGGLVEGAMNAWRESGRFSHHQVSLHVSPVWIDGDETRIEQILDNLVGNALKYTPAAGHVTVRVARDDEMAMLEVADTGVGIAAAFIGQVFDLFAQDEHALDRSPGGLGIGLTLVKALVKLHGGTVNARSDGTGKGSTLVVRLPGVPPAPPTRPPAAPPSAALPRRILVIEDNDDAREMLQAALVVAGHTVHEASNGATGIDLAMLVLPDAVLIDVGLPDLDGYEVARRLRATGRPMRLIAMTGYGQADDRRRALEAGFDVHLTKPVYPERLAAAIAGATREPGGRPPLP